MIVAPRKSSVSAPVVAVLSDEHDASLDAQTPLGAVGEFDDDVEEAPAQEVTQMLLFSIAEEWYAVPLSNVREVRQDCPISPVPCVPDFVLGVMSLRGEVVSVVDLARLMRIGGLESGYTGLPAVVVENDTCVTAVVVDALGDIAEVPVVALEPTVGGIERPQTAFLSGTLEVEDKMVGLLNADRVLQPVGDTPRSH